MKAKDCIEDDVTMAKKPPRAGISGSISAGITRRVFVGAIGLAAIGSASMFAGCAESRNASNSASSTDQLTTAEPEVSNGVSSEASSAAASSEAAAVPAAPSAQTQTNSLVLVFSRAGENYGVGTVEVGNTMVLAQMIADKTGADLFELERVTPYSSNYDECCDDALEEQNAGARPELVALPDLSGYEVVYFGFPCWWGDLPMPVYTAIEALDWTGKTIYPFNTHAGSGEAGMFTTVAQECSGATVGDGLTIAGVTAQNQRDEAESQVDAWLASMN